MAMTLGDLLQMVRQDYIDQLIAAAEDLHTDGVEVELEPVKGDADGEPLLEGVLRLPLRADVVLHGKDGTRQAKVEPEGVFRFDDAIRFDWEGMALEVFPFGWDHLPLTLRGLGGKPDWEPLRQWFERWFEEPEEPVQGPLREVVHFLSDPEPDEQGEGGTVRFVADLGSAPLEAWQDLLDACKACGAKALTIGLKEAA